ncbi:MAG: hypothetical protein Q8M20_00905 [Rhodocyclaceae bacterium]|nr:hypothetical protein [Rhodocyclaceae bacterium]MDZ4214947.1 hypothetical protein [Rhodocyclaceae bacterium]
MDEISDSGNLLQTDNRQSGAMLAPVVRDAVDTVESQADKLSYLIDLVGELVIASASANLLAHRSGQSALAEANSVVSHLVESIRDAALQMRMVKIGETFDRIHTATRNIARELGKDKFVIILQIDRVLSVDEMAVLATVTERRENEIAQAV